MAADIQTGVQYSSTWIMNAQKHWAMTATSRKTLIVFLKIPTRLKAEAAIALSLTCFSKANFDSRITFQQQYHQQPNQGTIKGSIVREREISIPLVLLGFTNIPHLLHQSLITGHSQIIIQ